MSSSDDSLFGKVTANLMDSKYNIWDQVQFHHRCLSDILRQLTPSIYVRHPLIQNFVARVAVQPLKKLLACSFLILTEA